MPETPAVYAERLTWGVEALESGQYPKGKGALHRITTAPDGTVTHQWCCLGVLSKVARDHGLPITSRFRPDDPDDPDDPVQLEEFDGYNLQEMLCPAVRDWFGFTMRNPRLRRADGIVLTAAAWNDCGPNDDDTTTEPDFTEIAAAFRRTYLGGTS